MIEFDSDEGGAFKIRVHENDNTTHSHPMDLMPWFHKQPEKPVFAQWFAQLLIVRTHEPGAHA